MNDIAKIERALKDADRCIDTMDPSEVRILSGIDVAKVRDQITEALMLLRQIPGQHSPTTAARQAVAAVRNASESNAAAALNSTSDADECARLRAALKEAERERDEAIRSGAPNRAVDAQFIVWRDRAEAAESRAAALEAERDEYKRKYLLLLYKDSRNG